MSADSIDLNVLVKDVVVHISLKKTDRVDEMFDIVSKEEDMKLLLEHVTKSSCKFRKLQQPRLPEYDDGTGLVSEGTVNQCKDTPKRVMQASYKISRYFNLDLEDEDSIHVMMQLPDVIKLNVLVQKALVSIDINNERTVKDIYEVSSNKAPTEVRELLQHVTKSSCIFHKLEQPILPEYDDGTGIVSEATVNKCKAKPKQLMQATEKIKKFFQSKPEDQERVHVLMELPDKIYRQIMLKVLIDNAVVSIDINNKRKVEDIYGTVSKKAPQRIKLLLGHVEVGDCQLHKLKQPILIQRDVTSKAVISATIEQCKTADAELMEPNQEIHDYFDSNPEHVDCVHVMVQLPAEIYGEICLNVLIYNALVTINIHNNGVVKNIYEKAKALLPEDVKRMTSDLETSKLIFEQIDPPIKFQPGSDSTHVSDETTRECQEAKKKTMMNQMQIVDYFIYDTLSRFHIHVVIRPPDDAIQNAINNMKRVDSSLYKRLQVQRMNPSAWSNADYPSLVEIGTVAAHKSFQELLDKRRTYNLESGNRFLKLALSVLGKKMFSEFVFENAGNLPNNLMPDDPATVSDGPATVSGEEFELLIFSTLVPAFVKRIERFKGNASSHFKQALFLWHFVLHPALAAEEQGRLILTTENESQIKYYVMCPKDGGWTTIGSYTPRSDMAIISKKLGCPFLLCEVDSNQTRKDKHRMLAVATSAARVGQYLLKKGTADVFVLMALFVTKDLVVERYLVSQTNVDDSDVVITEQKFDLERPEEAYEFLRQMYNFVHHVNEMARDLDETKEGLLQKINEAGKNIASYESNKKSEARDTGNVNNNRSLPGIPENQGEGNDASEDAPEDTWKRREVCELLERIGCNTDDRFDIDGHPGVICIPKEGEGLVYMKYISHRNIRELEILQYLKKFDPSWTYILPFEHWDINGGTLLKSPRGGIHVTDYVKRDSNPTAIVLQLVEAVGFLHEHNVAHRDIKPENIVVNSSGKLYIIDYSLARQVNGEDELRKGFVGTPGRVAPEVEKEDEAYSPVRADRWAVGNVIKIICGLSLQGDFLEHLSSLLMADDPSSRLSMRKCSKLIKQSQQALSKQQAVNVTAPSKFMNGGNNQPLVVAL